MPAIEKTWTLAARRSESIVNLKKFQPWSIGRIDGLKLKLHIGLPDANN